MEVQCALCEKATATARCERCGVEVCNTTCMRHDWHMTQPSTHRRLCHQLSQLSLVEAKRGRNTYTSELPDNYVDHTTKYAPAKRTNVQGDPYARLLNPDIARNNAWLKRFAQLDAREVRHALQTSPTFHYYLANNERFWFWYKRFHGADN